MATTSKKGKSSRDSKKDVAKKSEEEIIIVEEKKDDANKSSEDVLVEPALEEPPKELSPCPREPSPEVYEEPILTQLIVDRYEGGKVKGLYDGCGEAFFFGGHHYQGQFSEGFMHGKGVYTWSDGVTYEGDFVKNTINGYGTYTWKDCSKYIGYVCNGLRHGYGVLYSPSHRFKYSGYWKCGKQNGKGRMDYDHPTAAVYYDGNWLDNVRHGYGIYHYPSGNVYEGTWFKNVRHGIGTMKWINLNQSYTGQWENGVQHGLGQHVWYLRRGTMSQYSMRNMYDGDLVCGQRHGCGTFSYANGASYEGEWRNNLKCGKGKFVFKNGRVYEGVFDNDHIVEFPNFEMNGMNTPDMSAIRTRTPLPSERMSVNSNCSVNTYSPSFQLDVEYLLEEFDDADREEEASQVVFVMLRHITALHRIYTFYSQLGHDINPDNTFTMNHLQLWRLLKDCHLHHADYGLTDMDRWLARTADRFPLMHDPHTTLLFREFLNHLVVLAFHLYRQQKQDPSCLSESGPVLGWCLSRLITDKILPNACVVKGYFYYCGKRATNALVHMDHCFNIYQQLCQPRKKGVADSIMTMRQFVHLMKDVEVVNADLTAKSLVGVLASDDPKVTDEQGAINLELEMGFLDFFEALVGCAEIYCTELVLAVPITPGRNITTATPNYRGVFVMDNNDLLNNYNNNALQDNVNNTRQRDNNANNMGRRDQTVGDETQTDCRKNMAANKKGGSEETADGDKLLSCESLEGLTDQRKYQDAKLPSVRGEPAPQPVCQLDDVTRNFNFWTHQVHVFFMRKFFPGFDRLLELQSRMHALEFTAACDATKIAPDIQSDIHAEPDQVVTNIDLEEST